MAEGWSGADPVVQGDSGDYELGTEYVAIEDVTLTHVRVWADATEEGFVGRKGRIWSTAETLLGEASMPDTLSVGWSSHELAAPVERTAGQRWIVSYSTGGRYGALTGALGSAVVSNDGAVSTVAAGSATNGNGVFNETPGDFPQDAFGTTFYGVDVEYSLGTGGATPVITSVALASTGLDVIATINATDVEGLSGATYRVEWGDGDADSSSSASFAHTYAEEGLYAILARVTDFTGKTDYAAAAIQLYAALGFDPKAIVDAVASHAAASGHFDRVAKHEPKNVPGNGLSAAVWIQHLGPARGQSGLRTTSALLVLNVRVMSNMIQEPQDEIDPNILVAVSDLMGAYSGDFTLGGLVRNVDLLGQTGQTLQANAGYITISGQQGGMYRVMVISVPMVINDVWGQTP